MGCVDPFICGNAKFEFGEECDDGNIEEGDRCMVVCCVVCCGDGIV